MVRASGLAMLAALGVGLAYGALWWIGLSWGLIAVAVVGGWLIGTAVRRGILHRLAPAEDGGGPVVAMAKVDEAPAVTWPRGSMLLAALIGVLAWLAGTFIAFALVQSTEGAGPILERLTPANYVAFLEAMASLALLHALTLVLLSGVAAWNARAPAAGSPASEARR